MTDLNSYSNRNSVNSRYTFRNSSLSQNLNSRRLEIQRNKMSERQQAKRPKRFKLLSLSIYFADFKNFKTVYLDVRLRTLKDVRRTQKRRKRSSSKRTLRFRQQNLYLLIVYIDITYIGLKLIFSLFYSSRSRSLVKRPPIE